MRKNLKIANFISHNFETKSDRQILTSPTSFVYLTSKFKKISKVTKFPIYNLTKILLSKNALKK